MDAPLLAALAIFALAALGLGLWFAHASGRTRRALAQARQQHSAALAALAGSATPFCLVVEPGPDGWEIVTGALPDEDLRLRLEAGRPMGGDTKFIDLVTWLTLLPGSAWRALPASGRQLRLPEDAGGLTQLDLPGPLAAALPALVSELRIARDHVRLTARPGGPTVHRYSYGVHLMLAPDRLLQLLALGLDLARHLGQAASGSEQG